MVGPIIGVNLSRLLFICIFVYTIVALGEMIPIVFNYYAFVFFTVAAGVASAVATSGGKLDPSAVYIWMAVELIGGSVFILSIWRIMVIADAISRIRAT